MEILRFTALLLPGLNVIGKFSTQRHGHLFTLCYHQSLIVPPLEFQLLS